MAEREYQGNGVAQVAPGLSGYVEHPGFDPPAGYRADAKLVAAVNIAIFLEQPLLVTGDPGTGKTQLANSVAWELGLPLHVFHTRSRSIAGDLFYHYDALLHFNDAHVAGREPVMSRYVRFEALGRAIVRSMSPADRERARLPDAVGRGLGPPMPSVVLIDEAPRDFPTDILHEIERLDFEVRESDWGRLHASRECWPIVILTSNLEKALPDAFLRRCLFYYIARPTKAELIAIIATRIGPTDQGPLYGDGDAPASEHGRIVDAAVDTFLLLCENDRLLKRPSTAELLSWLRVLLRRGVSRDDILGRRASMSATLHVLLKNIDDLRVAATL
jgi:MoxR-like ATPase